MVPPNDGELRMADLARRTGVPPRTIRLYIARGLLEGPLRRGRKAAYGPQHVRRLREIRRLQEKGLTLREIAQRLAAEEPAAAVPRPEVWWRYALADDVVVSVREEGSPWRARAIHRAIARMAAELAASGKEREKGEENDERTH